MGEQEILHFVCLFVELIITQNTEIDSSWINFFENDLHDGGGKSFGRVFRILYVFSFQFQLAATTIVLFFYFSFIQMPYNKVKSHSLSKFNFFFIFMGLRFILYKLKLSLLWKILYQIANSRSETYICTF